MAELFTMGTIESIIFDWGGVLIDDPAPGLMQYCSAALCVSKEDYIKAHNKFAEDFQKGLISEDTFWINVCGELNKPLPKTPSLWGNAFRAVYRPRADMFSLVSSLHKAGYKTALLSNTEVPAMQFFHELQYDQGCGKTFALTSMFDVLVFSCAEGTKKPERKIYEITIERIGTKPDETLFIDDRQDFISGAKQIGLKTILFKDIEQLKIELARFGIM